MSSWKKGIYILLFIILLLQPHIIQGHIFFLSSAFLQSLATIMVFFIAYMTYFLHERDIQEKLKLNKEAISRQKQLLDNYQYIGVLNRRMPLLHEITTDILSKSLVTKKQKKEAFEKLLALATVSVGKAHKGLFRFVHSKSFHTAKEFQLIADGKRGNFQQVNNRQAMAVLSEKSVYTTQGLHILGSSEKDSTIKCVYMFSSSDGLEKEEIVLLQAIVDQAQLLYSHVYLKAGSVS